MGQPVTRRRHLLLPLLLGACAGPAPSKPAATAAPPAAPIIFSHALHQEQDIPCETCHAGIAASPKLGDRHSPKMKACAECHDVEQKAECKKCHPQGADRRALVRRRSTPHLLFSHARHMTRTPKKTDCVVCHATAVVARTLDRMPRPRMREDCFGCHNHLQDYRALRCKKCHDSLSQYPIRFVSAFNHEGNFLNEHGRWGRASSDLCATCHGQSFCADCHAAGRAIVTPSLARPELVGRRFIHRGDWVAQHALRSRADPASCSRCHSPKSCDACHRSRGVSALTATGRSPHPPDWLSPGSPNTHGREARRHITQCASCHDRGAASNCVGCHRSTARGGLGLNPHPPGWNRGGKNSDGVCVLCH